MSTKVPIMTHMIAGYPKVGDDLKVIKTLIDNQVAALEIQIPFSDPSADGPTIQGACNEALKGGFKVSQGFELIQQTRALTDIPIYLMSYASVVLQKGVAAFVQQAKESGANGLIIPDLCPGEDEGLREEGLKQGIHIIPVLVPTMSPSRLQEVIDMKYPKIYAALRVGITGTHTLIDQKILHFLAQLKGGGSEIMAGFGIDSRSQVEELSSHADCLILGSAIIRKVEEARSSGNYEEIVGSFVRNIVFGQE